ncbi:polyhydroxyalkanoate depolymerase [Pokkaliibacter sp. CJK22405]|uniref:polyhydroxyalkanoate depolymerase n=1 Tax=Pokkaliibacter sp. CJK22405 TaxID=3384615 RepID=UPI003984F1DC
MLYDLHAQTQQLLKPLNLWTQALQKQLTLPWSLFPYTPAGRTLLAGMELFERCTNNYEKPAFDISHTLIDGKKVRIHEETALAKPFCDLIHFRRFGEYKHPKVLMVAPLSGHYSTLLRGTVEHFLPDHEVYITDWRNARDVPATEGEFSFDDYVRYLIEFIELLGPEVHMVAVCQPSVPALVACAKMAQDKSAFQPLTLTLMGGPVDTRISPTEVNDYAAERDIDWFKNKVICTVPDIYPGAGQQVYPGFIQLSGFLMMNPDLHVQKHFKFFNDLIQGDGDSAEAHRKFYNEYLAVMDLPAAFYLDTIQKVFINHDLPKGQMTFAGEKIDLGAIQQTALMTVEGELDDITGQGQTAAAQKLCTGLKDEQREHYVQKGVGHYGIFNGRKFRGEVGPRIKSFMATHSPSKH